MSKLVLASIADGVASIRLNRPDAMNTLIPDMALELHDAIRTACDSDARVIALSSAGRSFCAGGDLNYLKEAVQGSNEGLAALIDPMHAAVEALHRTDLPVLVSLQGAVAGGGMSLALAADLAIAADNTVFAFAYGKIGITPDCGGSWHLPRRVGMRRAMEIALLGDRLDAEQALRFGLVNWVVPADALEAETATLAGRLAAISTAAARGMKSLMKGGLERDLPEQLTAEKQSFLTVAQSPGFQDAVRKFSVKGPPRS